METITRTAAQRSNLEEGTMIPSYNTLETITRARMEDRVAEAEQWRLARLARQGVARGDPTRAGHARTLGWLGQLATRLTGASV